LVTLAAAVLPSGLSLRCPDISLDIFLEVVSDGIWVSHVSEIFAFRMSDPLGLFGATGPANTSEY
jgi:hypothetical protein